MTTVGARIVYRLVYCLHESESSDLGPGPPSKLLWWLATPSHHWQTISNSCSNAVYVPSSDQNTNVCSLSPDTRAMSVRDFLWKTKVKNTVVMVKKVYCGARQVVWHGPNFKWLVPSSTQTAASYPGPTGELINIVKRREKSEREGKIRDGWWLILMSEILSTVIWADLLDVKVDSGGREPFRRPLRSCSYRGSEAASVSLFFRVFFIIYFLS